MLVKANFGGNVCSFVNPWYSLCYRSVTAFVSSTEFITLKLEEKERKMKIYSFFVRVIVIFVKVKYNIDILSIFECLIDEIETVWSTISGISRMNSIWNEVQISFTFTKIWSQNTNNISIQTVENTTYFIPVEYLLLSLSDQEKLTCSWIL